MPADQNQAASVLLNLVTAPPRPPKEPPADSQVLPPPPPVQHCATNPSLGSAAHEMRRCKPCAFFWKNDGCQSGEGCLFCHLCPPDEKKRRKKERRFVASMGNTDIREVRDIRARRTVRGPDGGRPQEYGNDYGGDYGEAYGTYAAMDGEVLNDWEEGGLPGMAHQDVEAEIIQKALLDQEVAEAEAEWGWRPYNSPQEYSPDYSPDYSTDYSPWNMNPRPVRLQLDKVLPASSNMPPDTFTDMAASSSVGVDSEALDDSPDPMSLLPTLLSPGAASPRSDDDKGSTGNVDSFFSGDPLASLFGDRR